MRIFRVYIIILLCAVVVCAAGCSSDQIGDQAGAGRIIPELSVCPDVVSVVDPSQVATIGNVPEAADFALKISTEDGAFSGVWDSFSAYFPAEPILPGTYKVEAYYGSPLVEGFDTPYYYGEASCTLQDGEDAQVQLNCVLANSLVSVDFSQQVKDYFPKLAVRLHSYGGSHILYPKDETRPAYIKPGRIFVGIVLQMPDGTECDFFVTEINDAKAGMWFPINVSVAGTDTDSPVITVSTDEKVNSDDISVALTPEFVHAQSPVIRCEGFVSGAPLNLVEGQTPENPLKMKVSAANLTNLILTTIAPSLVQQGWSPDIDLITSSDLSSLTALGLKIERGEDIVIDFTDLVPHLRDTDGLPDRFTLQAMAANGKSSAPVSLLVDLVGAEVSLLSVSSPTVGIDEASFKIFCDTDPSRTITLSMFDGKAWVSLPVTGVKEVEGTPHVYLLDFKVPAGNASIPVRLNYCGIPRIETELKRVSPEFEIEVDAFALKAVVRIKPKDESLLGTITSLVRIYAGNELAAQIDRDEDAGEIIVSGLKEKTSYRFKATVMANPDALDFTPVVSVTTEAVAELPNGDFEEFVNKRTKFSNMLSGGRFSQTIVEIFNLQNYADFNYTVPDGWANVNAKTFNTRASNINTWYVIPSVRTVFADEAYAGTAYAVRIDNVAFDPDGEKIADYVQEGQPYIGYSRSIPEIKYKSVGKIFLGSYKWDHSTRTEVYNEGIPFPSRPAALNGFYRFVPAVPGSSQKGYVRVEVLGDGDKVISTGEGFLIPALGYTAFTVPLKYNLFGEKAKKIKVMVAASPEVGTIEHETQAVVTVPDPRTSTSVGSSLWVDELAFSY